MPSRENPYLFCYVLCTVNFLNLQNKLCETLISGLIQVIGLIIHKRVVFDSHSPLCMYVDDYVVFTNIDSHI